ncbi:unnamed protein product [Caenorhabditis auriculariae]|uniref:Enhancer of rudimentary homolog n=1 Tax=Caenorhabditis auriculariae TaxID=2777116 RepID=A0A8S1HKN9_9PELO|nr:unnamed protein product [Caenorhabditis auriculariae]
MMEHTILLLQPIEKHDSRTWTDYNCVDDCLEGVCKVYEEFLKKTSPGSPSITYDITHLFTFIDRLNDLSVLVYDTETSLYTPHDKSWIKDRIFEFLRGHARGDQNSDDDDEEDDEDVLEVIDEFFVVNIC